MSYDIGPKIGLEGEKAFKQSLAEINSTLKILNSEMKLSASAFDGNANSMEALKSKSVILEKQYDSQKDKIEQMRKALENSKTTYGETSIQANNWQVELNKAETQLNKLDSEIRLNTKYLDEAKTSSKNTATSIDAYGKAVQTAGDKTSVFGDVFKANILSEALISGIRYLGSEIKSSITDSIELASNLIESQNVVDVVFKENSQKVNEWAKTLATAYGISELNGKKYVGTMGAMLESMGMTSDQTVKMSKSLVELAGDMASFYNIPVDEAFAKIRSGISGETEPLKQLGLNLSVANLEAFALAEGIEKTYKEMSQSEKALLSYNYLTKLTANAQGDFARTSNSYANQQRILTLEFDNFKTKIGKEVVPELSAAFTKINRKLEESGDDMADLAAKGVKLLVNGFELIVDHGEEVVSVIGGVAAGMAFFKAGSVIQSGITIATEAWKAYKLATTQAAVAQTALNVATSASMLGIAAIAVGAVTAGFMLYANSVKQSASEMDLLIEKTKDSVKEMQELRDQLASNAENRKNSQDDIIKESEATSTLASKLYELSGKEKLSNSEKAIMKSLVDELNEALPELNLKIDSQTGALNLQKTEVDKLINSNLKLLQAEAAQDDLKKIAADKYQAEKKIADKQKERLQMADALVEAEKKFADASSIATSKNMEEANKVKDLYAEKINAKKAIEALDAEIKNLGGDVSKLGVEWNETTKLVGDYTGVDAATQAIDIMGKTVVASSKDAATAINDMVGQYKESLDAANDKIYNSMSLFDEFAIDTTVSSQTLMDNLAGQIKGMSEWAENMRSLSHRGVSEGLLAELYAMGPQAASQIAALNGMTDEQLNQYVSMWQQKSALAKGAAEDSLAGTKTSVQNEITSMTQTVEQKMDQSGVTAAQNFGSRFGENISSVMYTSQSQFKEMGENSAQGFNEGWEGRSRWVLENVRSTFGSMIDSARDVLGIHSPSRVFGEMGYYSAVGYGNEFEKEMKDVNSMVKDVLPTDINLGEVTGKYTSNINTSALSSAIITANTGNDAVLRSMYDFMTEYFPKFAEGQSMTLDGDVITKNVSQRIAAGIRRSR